MSSLEYLLQPRDSIVMSRYPYIKWICLDVQYTIHMCLQRTILSDRKPIGELTSLLKVMNMICWIAPVGYRHVNVQYKQPVELLCSDLIGPYHKYRSTMSTHWLTKGELGKVGVCSNIAQIHSSGLWEVIIQNVFGHYWPKFTWRFD